MQVLHVAPVGTGAGMGTLLISKVREEYPDRAAALTAGEFLSCLKATWGNHLSLAISSYLQLLLPEFRGIRIYDVSRAKKVALAGNQSITVN